MCFPPLWFFFSLIFMCLLGLVVIQSCQQHNIISVATVVSPGEFCSLASTVSVLKHTQVCQTVSCLVSDTYSYILPLTHNCRHKSNTRHIFMKWHHAAGFRPGAFPSGLGLFFFVFLLLVSICPSRSLSVYGCYRADTFLAAGTAPT